MRPRIEPIEAKFLVEVLEKDKGYYELLEQKLNEKMKPLQLTVSKACWYVRGYNLTYAQREYDYPNCANQLCKLQAEDAYVLRKVALYKELIAKYRQIAEGKKGRGRYPLAATNINDKILHLEDKIFLGYKDYRMPIQVEAPKI
jgi:hypothetical protein